MPIEFTFTIPQRLRAPAVKCAEELVEKSEYPEVRAAFGRIVAAMRVNKLLHAKDYVLGESHSEPTELFTDRFEVRVPIEDIEALKLVLNHCHAAEPPDGDDGKPDADWEDWSWHALHMIYPFENASVIDHLGSIE